ncbi:MAG TPA: hypothetical protein VH440_02810 [Candidatus Limnocylindrales bacterium]
MPRQPVARLQGRSFPVLAILVASLMVAACRSAAPAAPTVAPVASRPAATKAPTVAPRPPASRAPSAAPSDDVVASLPRNGRIVVDAAGYAVTLPKNWFRVDLTRADLEQFAKAGSQALGAGMTDKLLDQVSTLVASGISLFAFRFADKEASVGTNLNVISLPSLGMDLDTLESLNVGQLQGIVGKGVKIAHAREQLAAGEAIRLAYTVPGSTTTNGQSVALIQHLILDGNRQLIITCTAPNGISRIADECDGMAKSVEFL